MTYGITEKGFIRKPLTEIREEVKTLTKQYYGNDIDLSLTSPIGAMAELMSVAFDVQWAHIEDVFYSVRLDTASGVALDYIVKIGLMSRRPKQFAVAKLEFEGEIDALVPENTICDTSTGITFKTLKTTSIESNGKVTIDARAETAGSGGVVPANSIVRIKTPVIGVNAVTNPEPSSGGRERETAPELRERYKDTKTTTGSSVDAIVTAVEDLPGVVTAAGFENLTNDVDDNGIPWRSFEIIVYGGIDEEIAATIKRHKPAGVSPVGNTEVILSDSQGDSKRIRFSRPAYVDIYVSYTVYVNDDWSNEFIETMQSKAIQYIGGIDSGIEFEGVGIGGDIYQWELTAQQKGIKGIERISTYIGKTPNPSSEDNVNILARERPRTTASMITVNVISL